MFGPSVKTIPDTILDIEAWLDTQPKGYTDFDGSWAALPATEEEDAALQRLVQLKGLMELRTPVSKTDWGVAMHFGYCPCPGVPRHLWDGQA